MTVTTQRQANLTKLFYQICEGNAVSSSHEAKLFLEACRTRSSAVWCLEKLLGSKKGFVAIRSALTIDISYEFIIANSLPFLKFFSDPAVANIVDGIPLRRFVVEVVEPPTFWNALLDLFTKQKLNAPAELEPFAWLVSQVVILPFDAGPGEQQAVDFSGAVKRILVSERLKNSSSLEVRNLHAQIEHRYFLRYGSLENTDAGAGTKESTFPCGEVEFGKGYMPGGRHNNDHADFRRIKVLPTADEFGSTAKPFYRLAQEVRDYSPVEARVAIHLDNQFRLNREDMLQELRASYQAAIMPPARFGGGGGQGGRACQILWGLRPVDISLKPRTDRHWKKFSLIVECTDLKAKLSKDIKQREKYLRDHPWFLKDLNFGVLCWHAKPSFESSAQQNQKTKPEGEIVAFAFVERVIEDLCQSTPKFGLQFPADDTASLTRALMALNDRNSNLCFILVNTPVFAYEPVLKGLQAISDVPLLNLLVDSTEFDSTDGENDTTSSEPETPVAIHEKLQSLLEKFVAVSDNENIIAKLKLDHSQAEAIINFLINPISLTVGPPGTGKSYVGAQMANMLVKHTTCRVLLITYTHHALDDALAQFSKAGIPPDNMVRLGNPRKATDFAAQMSLANYQKDKSKYGYSRSKPRWDMFNALRAEVDTLADLVERATTRYDISDWKLNDFNEFWEFSQQDKHFFGAFSLPITLQRGQQQKRKNEAPLPSDYLFWQWIRGQSIGNLRIEVENKEIWDIPPSERQILYARWKRQILEDRASSLAEHISMYNKKLEQLNAFDEERDTQIASQKRVIACTTTAAAKYHRLIAAIKPEVVMVEEAGEILESHILTALTPSTKQLVMIGDHKQLRPKISTYSLTVEKGDGYDLNMSLFERLICEGMPHTTLMRQHRSHPDLSCNIRELTYPNLQDTLATHSRPPVRGLQDRLVFVNHEKPEDEDRRLHERGDPGAAGSKRNSFEANLVVHYVRYLVQQGYGTKHITVLTPYLGQLLLLRDMLAQEHDPWLNDLDSSELVRAGQLTLSASRVNKPKLRISTIDNYQGEEADIVIISLTRSNENGSIGFLAADERLNVLLSRARNGMILIGNMATFLKSRGGNTNWPRLFELLKRNGHIYEGLPIQCEQHPERKFVIISARDFERLTPEGGCDQPCGAPLSCGFHNCERRCHPTVSRFDSSNPLTTLAQSHANIPCSHVDSVTCERGHVTKVACMNRLNRCGKCVEADLATRRRVQRDLALERVRLEQAEKYREELQRIDDEVDRAQRLIDSVRESEQHAVKVERARERLASLQETAERVQNRAANKAALVAASNATNNDSQNTKKQMAKVGCGKASEEWESLKSSEGVKNSALDELMAMIGLEDVKNEFLEIKLRVDTAVRQGVNLNKERFGIALLGNPGTGKTTVARLYADFMMSVGVIPGHCFKEVTGASLAQGGVAGAKKLLDDILNDGGGVMFIDEAYQLTSGNNVGGGAVLDYMLAEVENLTGKIIFVLAGYDKPMEQFFAHNPGLPSRFPHEIKFADYTDNELLQILSLKIEKKYNDNMKVDEGISGLYCRIATRRLGKSRGKEGFGNARAVENLLAKIESRQSKRLRAERKHQKKDAPSPDVLLFTKEDIIGPEPGEAVTSSHSWKTLQKMVGLKSVKDSIQVLLDTLKENYSRELAEEPVIEYSLNKVFLGNPGTGKTTVAKLYGAILADLGLLSKGQVVVKLPADFIGSVLGESENKTRGILEATVGKVLVIDEAYSLYTAGGTADPYRTAVIDTIVSQVHNVPGDDRCVLLLGYREEMEKMFQNVNPGFSRRFPLASAFEFEDFDDEGLRQILELKLKEQGYTASEKAMEVAVEVLSRARTRPKFGNGGEVENLLNIAKAEHRKEAAKKFGKGSSGQKRVAILEPWHFDKDYDRAQRAETNVESLFAGEVGRKGIIDKLKEWQRTVVSMKALDMDPREVIPFNFLFKGPPGTGKTTTAAKMGKVFYDMGFLATARVEQCTVTDIVGQFVGHTGPKVLSMLDKALGGVLFIDEAYRLLQGGFSKEAIDELVDATTREKYNRKLVIILAGYDEDIDHLMATNPGLTSRFPETLKFDNLSVEQCVTVLVNQLVKYKRKLASGKSAKSSDGQPTPARVFDISILENPTVNFTTQLHNLFSRLSKLEGWANSRDVNTVASSVWSKTLVAATTDSGHATDIIVREQTVIEALETMLVERESRHQSAHAPVNSIRNLRKATLSPTTLEAPTMTQSPAPEATTNTIATTEAMATKVRPQTPSSSPTNEENNAEAPSTGRSKLLQQVRMRTNDIGGGGAVRDAGVSDAVWQQLERDRQAEVQQEEQYALLRERVKKAEEKDREILVRQLLAEDENKKRVEKEKALVKSLGRCPAGYDWIKQATGWRCAGGSHYISEDEVDKLKSQ